MSRKPESAPPIFFFDKDCPPDMTNIDILEAVESFTEDPSAAICARRTGGLWRLYASTLENKAKLMANQFISIYNNVTEEYVKVKLHLLNPYATMGKDGKEIPGTRITIDGLPLSVSDGDLEDSLLRLGVKPRSRLMWERVRKRDKTIHPYWITGRRFMWIDLPEVHLGHTVEVGAFSGSLFYREQGRPDKKCFKCGKVGHVRSACTEGQPEGEGSDSSRDSPQADGNAGGALPHVDTQKQKKKLKPGDEDYCSDSDTEGDNDEVERVPAPSVEGEPAPEIAERDPSQHVVQKVLNEELLNEVEQEVKVEILNEVVEEIACEVVKEASQEYEDVLSDGTSEVLVLANKENTNKTVNSNKSRLGGVNVLAEHDDSVWTPLKQSADLPVCHEARFASSDHAGGNKSRVLKTIPPLKQTMMGDFATPVAKPCQGVEIGMKRDQSSPDNDPPVREALEKRARSGDRFGGSKQASNT